MICSRCGEYRTQLDRHGREPGDQEHLCDTCYWRGYAEKANEEIQKTIAWVKSQRQEQARRMGRFMGPLDDGPQAIKTEIERAEAAGVFDKAYEKARDELKGAFWVWWEGPSYSRDPEEIWNAVVDRVLPPR